MSFSTKAKQSLCPSINLTEEIVLVDISEYLKSVQKLYLAKPKTRWHHLGSIETKSGKAALTAIDTETPLGKVHLLQAILIRDKTAYILTAAAPKEDFFSYQPLILDSFRSLTLTQTIEELLSPEKKLQLQTQIDTVVSLLSSVEKQNFQKHTEWNKFQDFLLREFPEQGAYWQALVLAKTQDKCSCFSLIQN